MILTFLNSILSCIFKCIRIILTMTDKKIILGLFLISSLSSCGSPTAMLGPAYTFTSTGNVAYAGFSYGSNEFIKNYTGKTPLENLEVIVSGNKEINNNIKKQTLESEDFYQLVKNKIEMSKNKIKISNQ